MIEWKSRIERHVRLVLVLAQPRSQIRIAILEILVEDHHDRANLARQAISLPHEYFLAMPVADGFADIDAVQNGGGEGLDAHPLLGKQRFRFFLDETAVFFDD